MYLVHTYSSSVIIRVFFTKTEYSEKYELEMHVNRPRKEIARYRYLPNIAVEQFNTVVNGA